MDAEAASDRVRTPQPPPHDQVLKTAGQEGAVVSATVLHLSEVREPREALDGC
jgi:hypothetical protein